MDLFHYLLIWVCLVGLCLGSFYNVVILRSLSNESIVFPPSKCPKCGNRLYFWHNIPVLSYILLRGKCFFCKEKISIQYPLIELTTMLLFVLVYFKFGISWTTIFMLFYVSGFLIMTVTDLKEQIVDCNIAIAICLAALLYAYLSAGVDGLISAVLGTMAGAIVMEIVARLGYLFAGTRAMGEADTYVAGALGAIFGIHMIAQVLFAALIASMIFIFPAFVYRQYKNNNKLTCVMSILFILSIVVFKALWQNYWTLALLVITGVGLAVSILKQINKEENRTYLPYVPALVAGALYFIFV